jgi:hypothetical protein
MRDNARYLSDEWVVRAVIRLERAFVQVVWDPCSSLLRAKIQR